MAAFTIAWNGLRRTVRERQNLFWMFVAPLMFVSFFGVLLRPSPPRPTRVAIVNEDAPGTAAARFATALVADGVDARVVQTRPAADSGLALVIPKGTSDALAAGTGVKVVLLAGVEQTNEERRLQFKIQKAVVDLTLQGGEAETTMTTGSAPLAVQNASLDIRQQGNTRGFQFAVPAYLVMFTFMNLLVSGAALAEERAAGQLRRLAMAPIGFNQIILGKLLVRVAVGWAQMGYLLLVGILVFNIHWGGNPVTLFAFLSLVALAAAALGLLIGTVFDDPDKCANLAVWSVMILAPLGGLWWPLEIVGPTLRTVGNLVPTGWAMQAVNSIMAFGAGPSEVWPFAAPLAGLFGVSFVLAGRRLRRQVVR